MCCSVHVCFPSPSLFGLVLWDLPISPVAKEQIRDLLVPLTDKPAKLTAPLLQVELDRIG